MKKCERKRNGKKRNGKREKKKSGKKRNGENYKYTPKFLQLFFTKHLMKVLKFSGFMFIFNHTVMSIH
ncbi:MAG: hypothetical protein C0193_02015 [Candidatus Bathyarchaeota archaeon]|nr:MAG: hypothetical protein C0193_02015 [Candidatus Bathyarchaeota archaeon]